MRLLALVALASLCSCASIVSGGPDSVAIASAPAGAMILHKNSQVGVTPATISIAKGADDVVILRLDGYHDQMVKIGRGGNGWVIGNALFGLAGILGIVIDCASGAASPLDTTPVSVVLVPVSGPAPELWTRAGSKKSETPTAATANSTTYVDADGWTHTGNR